MKLNYKIVDAILVITVCTILVAVQGFQPKAGAAIPKLGGQNRIVSVTQTKKQSSSAVIERKTTNARLTTKKAMKTDKKVNEIVPPKSKKEDISSMFDRILALKSGNITAEHIDSAFLMSRQMGKLVEAAKSEVEKGKKMELTDLDHLEVVRSKLMEAKARGLILSTERQMALGMIGSIEAFCALKIAKASDLKKEFVKWAEICEQIQKLKIQMNENTVNKKAILSQMVDRWAHGVMQLDDQWRFKTIIERLLETAQKMGADLGEEEQSILEKLGKIFGWAQSARDGFKKQLMSRLLKIRTTQKLIIDMCSMEENLPQNALRSWRSLCQSAILGKFQRWLREEEELNAEEKSALKVHFARLVGLQQQDSSLLHEIGAELDAALEKDVEKYFDKKLRSIPEMRQSISKFCSTSPKSEEWSKICVLDTFERWVDGEFAVEGSAKKILQNLTGKVNNRGHLMEIGDKLLLEEIGGLFALEMKSGSGKLLHKIHSSIWRIGTVVDDFCASKPDKYQLWDRLCYEYALLYGNANFGAVGQKISDELSRFVKLVKIPDFEMDLRDRSRLEEVGEWIDDALAAKDGRGLADKMAESGGIGGNVRELCATKLATKIRFWPGICRKLEGKLAN